MTVIIVGLTSLNSHLPSLAISNGFSADTGALLLSASMIGNLTFKLLLGVIIDRWGVIKGFLTVLTVSLVGFFIILFVKGSTIPLLIGGYLYGTIFSLGSLGLSILARYLYGNDQYNAVYSKMTLVTSLASAAFVILIGLLYDITGSYSAPVILGIGMTGAALFLTLFLAVKTGKAGSKSKSR